MRASLDAGESDPAKVFPTNRSRRRSMNSVHRGSARMTSELEIMPCSAGTLHLLRLALRRGLSLRAISAAHRQRAATAFSRYLARLRSDEGSTLDPRRKIYRLLALRTRRTCTRCPGLAYMEGNMRGPSIAGLREIVRPYRRSLGELAGQKGQSCSAAPGADSTGAGDYGDQVVSTGLSCWQPGAIAGSNNSRRFLPEYGEPSLQRRRLRALHSSDSPPPAAAITNVHAPFVMPFGIGLPIAFAKEFCHARKLQDVLFLVTAISLVAATANSQDEPSLGDLARQQRQQKQQTKTAPGKDAKPLKVITNEELPAHTVAPSTPATDGSERTSAPDSANAPKVPASNGSRKFNRKKVKLLLCKARSIS